ncbi:GNAT family N-acetyltransferase [Candidatus Poribacteria bacterium]
MKICDYDYTHSDAEFEEMWELLVESYAITGKPHNWFFSRLENWRYASPEKPPTHFMNEVHLWRNEASELVGFCISEHSENSTHLQIHPDYRFVEADMLSWIERCWAKDKERIETYAGLYDPERQELLAQQGYEDIGDNGYVREYDLSKTYPVVALPQGFRIEAMSENCNYSSRIAVESKTFDSAFINQEWFDGKSSAPSYSSDLDFSVVSPEGEHLAFCLAWIDHKNQIAEIDPVGTHPDYQRRRFAKAVVSECFRRLRARGVRYAYIGSGPEPYISNRLYESLQPVGKYQENRWAKNLLG